MSSLTENEPKLRVGVVGLGKGLHHIQCYRRHPRVEVVAIADIDEARVKQVMSEHRISKSYPSAEEMVSNEALDLVSICTPNIFHRSQTIAALEAGCHVLCEKPMALNAMEAREMLEAAHRTGKRLMINFSYRFTDQAWAIKHQIDSGILGDVYYAYTCWHRRRGMPGFGGHFSQKALSGGGPLIDLGVHRLDLALWFMGYPKPAWVMGNAYDPIASRLAEEAQRAFDVEDFAAGQIRFTNGSSLTIEASWASNRPEAEFMETRLYGSDGGLVQRNLRETYEFEAEMYFERNGAQYDMRLHPPVPEAVNPNYYFADCILNDRPHMATGEEGLVVQELLDALYASAAEGAPVRVED